jgi:hypothetical protein
VTDANLRDKLLMDTERVKQQLGAYRVLRSRRGHCGQKTASWEISFRFYPQQGLSMKSQLTC